MLISLNKMQYRVLVKVQGKGLWEGTVIAMNSNVPLSVYVLYYDFTKKLGALG